MLLTNNNPWRSVDETGSSYWSGLDVKVYIQGTYIEELIGIQYALMENATPIYGYGSYVYDAILRGTRMVQGAMTVNFKEPGYLRKLITIPAPGVANVMKVNGNIENPNTLSDFKTTRRNAILQSIWGDEPVQSTPAGNTPMLARSFEDHDGFDLVLKYGEVADKVYTLDRDGNGSLSNMIEGARAITLVGTQFTHIESTIDESGKPLIESYQFIAKDITYSLVDSDM